MGFLRIKYEGCVTVLNLLVENKNYLFDRRHFEFVWIAIYSKWNNKCIVLI